jgi:DNA polymerase
MSASSMSGVVRDDASARLLRQHVETGLLMGVDFVPIRSAPSIAAPLAAPRMERAPADDPGRRRKTEALEALRLRHAAECPHCVRATGITNLVFGEGDPAAQLMFVGEAPGMEEDRTGRPFVGRAGQKLEDMIRAMGLRREDVYIANVLKARPPDNRTPLPDEVAACAPFLAEQIAIIAPRVIVALGGPAAKFLLGTSVGITRLRGTWGIAVIAGHSVDVMPTFHPAYLLRNYTRDTRERMWSDLQAVSQRLATS